MRTVAEPAFFRYTVSNGIDRFFGIGNNKALRYRAARAGLFFVHEKRRTPYRPLSGRRAGDTRLEGRRGAESF